jgi:hypothetical protein
MYSAKAGRFLQPDPIGYEGGMNLYDYVGNDPVNRKDPSGLCWQLVPVFLFGTSILDDGQSLTTQYRDTVWKCIWGSNGEAQADPRGSQGDGGGGGGELALLPPCQNVSEFTFTSHIGEYARFGAGGRPLGLKLRAEAEINLFTYNTPLEGEPYWDQGFELSLQVHKVRVGFDWGREGRFSPSHAKPSNFFLWDFKASTEGVGFEIKPPQMGAGFTLGIDNVMGLIPLSDTKKCEG